MPEPTGTRPVQITILAEDVPKMVAFYSHVLDAEFNDAISSFQFGAWNTDSFFLLTIEQATSEYRGGSISLTVFPAVGLVGLGGREAVAEGDSEGVDGWLPPHGPPDLAFPGRVQGPGD
jgi:catechol 2,3-dioxygenase-like lactoylglutathione lyase family enzyme